MKKDRARLRRRSLLTAALSICLYLGLCVSPARAQQVGSESINAQIVETLHKVFDCYDIPTTHGPVFTCAYDMRFYLYWSKDTAFPSVPSGTTPYWSSFVWMRCDNFCPGSMLIGSKDDYSGVTFGVTQEGRATPAGILAIRQATLNSHWRAFSTLTMPDGEQITLESNVGIYEGVDAGPQDPQLALKPQNNPFSCGDPVYLHSGQFYYQCHDLNIPGRKINVDIGQTYYSGMSFNGPFGYGWMISYYMRLYKIDGGDVMIVSGDGRKTQYTFDGSAYTPPPGRFEALSGNPDGSWTLTEADGAQYHFDAAGRLVSIEDRDHNTVTLTYATFKQAVYGYSPFSQDPTSQIPVSLDYRLLAITDTSGRTVNLTYNASGLLEKIIDGSREVVFTYDPATNDLLSVTKPATPQFPAGVTKSFEYENHNVKRIQDAKSQYFVENTYDTQGRVAQQNLGGNTMNFDYTVPAQVTEIDRKGYVTQFNFNANGNMIRKEEFTAGLRAGEPVSFVTTYAYNVDMLKTSETFPRGNGAKYTYDSANPQVRDRGNLLEVRRKTSMAAADDDTADIVTHMTYETLFNQPKTVTDPKGNTTTYTYDYELDSSDPKYATRGDLILIEAPSVAAGIPVTEFSYNSYGQVTEAADPNGNVTQYAYDATTGYLTDVYRDPSGINAHTHFTYDANGNPDQVTDPDNHTTDYDYDDLGWLDQVADPLGHVTKYTYDANGNVAKTEKQASEPAGTWQTTQFTYDILNHLKTVTDPLTRVTTYNYDANENLASVEDAQHNTTSYVYDERDLLFTTTDANTPAGVTTYDYDLNGNLAKITDAKSQETAYSYDLFDRRTATQYADLSSSQFTYDKNSNLTEETTPSGKPIDYTYDALNRMTAKTYPQTPGLDSTYAYDLGSRMTDADNAASQVGFSYDTLNRLAGTTQTLSSMPFALSYQYDAAGNRTQLGYPSGKTVNETYDANNRMDLVKVNTATLADYAYDPLNRRTQKSFLSATLPLTAYGYDIANQLTSVTNTLVNATPVSQYAYPLYDNVGNRKELDRTLQTQPTQSTQYAYNNIYELTGVTGAQTNAYDYDGVGNRQVADGTAYTSNSLNQYTDVGAAAYAYDGNGNLAYDGSNTYAYDESNRLSTFSSLLSTAVYQYDALNRRISKTVGGTTTYFVYDGDSVVAEYDGGGSLNAEYVLGDKIDEVLTMERGGNTYYYNYNGLGSVSEITDSSGAIAENYEYDAYGNPSITGSLIGNPYMFTGRRWDAESGIYYYRARQYDPSIGRFLQRDPIGIEGGINLYAYASNNPTNFIDPDGNITIPFTNIWVNAGENYGQSALEYWANKAARASNPFAGGFYNTMGFFAALWTPCTSDATVTVLASGYAAGRYLGRPYYQYYPAGNPGYSSPYLTRGWGWKAPWKTGTEAVEKLSLPPYNPGTAVRQIKVNPFQYLRGPGRVPPEFGQPGGGTQYILP